LKLVTSRIRTTPPNMFDMRLNSHSRLNFILAMIDVIDTGADEALMLDPNGHIASCNATNFFWVVNGEVRTSTGAFCFNGITRDNVIALCRANGIPLKLADFLPDDVAKADEAFVTGTFGGLTPVREIDGRALPAALPGPMTKRLRDLYAALKEKDAAS
jgi:branched-chain amino acid aminotransferase